MKSSSMRRKGAVVGARDWRGGLLLVLLLMGSAGTPDQGFANRASNFISAKVLPAF